MTFRIDRASTDEGTVLQVVGRIAAEDAPIVLAALDEQHVVAIDLAEIGPVAREMVWLLARAEAGGITLTGCPAYLREWITQERQRSSPAE